MYHLHFRIINNLVNYVPKLLSQHLRKESYIVAEWIKLNLNINVCELDVK